MNFKLGNEMSCEGQRKIRVHDGNRPMGRGWENWHDHLPKSLKGINGYDFCSISGLQRGGGGGGQCLCKLVHCRLSYMQYMQKDL